jgi:hypothetical protein
LCIAAAQQLGVADASIEIDLAEAKEWVRGSPILMLPWGTLAVRLGENYQLEKVEGGYRLTCGAGFANGMRLVGTFARLEETLTWALLDRAAHSLDRIKLADLGACLRSIGESLFGNIQIEAKQEQQ